LTLDLYYIESPRITNFGEWGNTSLCPEREFVYAFRLKVQADQGIFVDDTAMNGIELTCVSPQGLKEEQMQREQRTKVAVIRSSEGDFGNWGTIFECPFPHFAVGFELRSEGFTLDITAANNLRILCSNDMVLQGNGQSWGDWTGELRCPRTMAICGLRNQVQARITGDNTALNNVDFVCCERDL